MRSLCLILVFVPFSLVAEEGKWKAQVGVSYVQTGGNTRTQTFSGKCTLEGRAVGFRWGYATQYLYARHRGKEQSNRLFTDFRGERILTGRLFGFVGISHQMDRYAGYVYRLSIGPGVGLDFIRKETRFLKGMASCFFYNDRYAVGMVSKDRYPTAKAGVNGEWKLTPTTLLKGFCEGIVSLKETDRYFANADLSLQVSISSNLSIGVGTRVAYQSRPPGPHIRKMDTTFLSSLLVNW